MPICRSTAPWPLWLAERMTKLGTAIVEAILQHYGHSELLSRLADPFWFQALGSVMGMDWILRITTSVMGALNGGLTPRADELGIYICGGRGKYSATPRMSCAQLQIRNRWTRCAGSNQQDSQPESTTMR